MKPKLGRGKVLLVDNDSEHLQKFSEHLTELGFVVETATEGPQAIRMLQDLDFDTIVSEIMLPKMDGLQLLRSIRGYDLDVPVLLMTEKPALDTAIRALEYGALRYLVKPIELKELGDIVAYAVRLHGIATMKRQALKLLGDSELQAGDRAGSEVLFERALKSVRMEYQPIVCWSEKRICGYEALLRTDEPVLPNPAALIHTGERLGRTQDLGRAIREKIGSVVDKLDDETLLFINLHTLDLVDEELFSKSSPLAPFAKRIVFEITERIALDEVKDAHSRVAQLRNLGYRIAIDDLGAGYAGLTSFAQLEPEVVKLDLGLVRNINEDSTKQKLAGSVVSLCKELDIMMISEGIETIEERDTIFDLGGDMMQGYLFGRPGPAFPGASI